MYASPARRARAISIWVSMFGVGMALGPALGGVLVGTVGWQAVFWVNIPVVLIAWELRRQDPLIDLRYFRGRSFTAAVLIAVCAFADMGGFLFLSSIYLQDVRGSSAVHAAMYMLPAAFAMAVCPPVAAWVTAALGSARPPLLIGGLALMLSTDSMARLTTSSPDIRLLATFGLFGAGMGMVNSQITVAAVSGMPAGQAGLASGIASASRQVGQALGVAVAGSLLTTQAVGNTRPALTMASYPAWHVLFWCASAVLACGLLTSRAPARHGKRKSSLSWIRPAPRADTPRQLRRAVTTRAAPRPGGQ